MTELDHLPAGVRWQY